MLRVGHSVYWAAAAKETEMSDWEYCTIDVSAMKFDELPELLAELDRHGWELAPLEPAGAEQRLLLRLRRPRPRVPSAQQQSLIAG